MGFMLSSCSLLPFDRLTGLDASVRCGATACVGQAVCCVNRSSASCVEGSCMGAAELACDDASDCAAGSGCCSKGDDLGSKAVCLPFDAGCAGMGERWLCVTDRPSDCPLPGSRCIATQAFPGGYFKCEL
jgi:hypothetical protein